MPITGVSVDHSQDVHYQATLLRAWDQEYTQLKPGAFAGSVSTLRNGAVKLFSERMNRATLQMGSLPGHRVAFGLPLRAAGPSHICGEAGDQHSLLVFSGASGFEFRSPEDFEFFGVEIGTDDCDDPVFCELVSMLERSLSAGSRAIALDRRRAAKLGRVLGTTLSDECIRDRLLDCPEHAAAFNRGLLGWLLDILQMADAGPQRQVTRHWDAITAVRDLVRDSEFCPISVAELTVALGLSRRTLQIACQEAVGLSPVQYLRALRLSEARRMMERASSVTEAATQYGFWHLGYFAKDYCTMFGELPSRTLERHRARNRSG